MRRVLSRVRIQPVRARSRSSLALSSYSSQGTPNRGRPHTRGGVGWNCLAPFLNLALPRSRSWESFFAIAVTDVAVALTVLLVVNKVALRALPLATLLSLSLVFPDRAPKRFSIVLRANSTSQLRSRIVTSHHDDIDVMDRDRRPSHLLGSFEPT